MILTRAMQVLGALLVPVGAWWFWYTAGGRYGEFERWQRFLSTREEPKAGLLMVVAGIVVFVAASMRARRLASE